MNNTKYMSFASLDSHHCLILQAMSPVLFPAILVSSPCQTLSSHQKVENWEINLNTHQIPVLKMKLFPSRDNNMHLEFPDHTSQKECPRQGIIYHRDQEALELQGTILAIDQEAQEKVQVQDISGIDQEAQGTNDMTTPRIIVVTTTDRDGEILPIRNIMDIQDLPPHITSTTKKLINRSLIPEYLPLEKSSN